MVASNTQAEFKAKPNLVALTRLAALGIVHGDICDEPYRSGLFFGDPDNIALEFVSSPA
jgi:hypothetical protein